jgi:geranylgeranyl diphosphate synthase type II
MTELKTASLVAACLKTGAIIAGAKAEDAGCMYEFGKNIGIAFQLQDDILDAYGSEAKFGKQKGGDIIANKKTFLLLKALEVSKHNPYKREELQQWVYSPVADKDAKQKVEAVTAIYDFLNVRKLAEEEMLNYYKKGLSFLEKILANESKKANLKKFIESLMNREE